MNIKFLDLPPEDWPFRTASQFATCDGLRWHYQQLGTGPTLLLVHGTGGSAHSWHHTLTALAEHYTVLAVDLPGHGFTTVPSVVDATRDVYSLEGMARELHALLSTLGLTPTLVAGHSAGVAVLLRLVLDGHVAPTRIVGFNPALVAPPALYIAFIAPLLGAIVQSSAVADSGAWLARQTGIIRTMLQSTGTQLSAEDLARYEQLCRRPAHVHAALAMMSRWDLPRIVRDAISLRIPLTLVAGRNDRWVPLASLQKSIACIPTATMRVIDGAGHLLLEERPDVVTSTLLAP